jgi:methyl-accepting chemotaxis protein
MSVSSITIRTKVCLAFGLVLAITVALGGFAINRLAQVNAEAGEIREKWLPGTQAIARMGLSLEQYRVAEGRALVAASSEASQAVEADLKTRAQELQRQRAAYEATIVDPAERAAAGAFDRAWDAYKVISDEMLGAVHQGAKDQAALIYNGKARAPVAEARASAARLMDFDVEGGHAAALRGQAVYAAARTWIVSALGLAVLLCGLTAIAVVRSVSTPVLTMARTMKRLADGDTDTDIAGVGRKDEIGRMADALAVFRTNAIERVRLEGEHAEQEERAAEEKQQALSNMAETIETETTSALDQIGQRTAALAATAEEMSALAKRTGDSARSAATASAQAMANVQTVASAAEELRASIHEISGQVAQSSEIVGRAVAAGGETRTTIEALNEQVTHIGTVADMIGEIAAKTNLLALNATIEAARAGDAGKGFAVVASEVKALATQTARSTQEITRHIGEVRAATGASVTAVARIEQTIGEINAIATSIAAAVEEQAGKRAVEVRENTGALNDAVGELRHSVIRVVRTSTAEVDRRRSARHAIDLPCRLSVPGGETCAVHVTDISASGASVRGGPALPPGTRGSLLLDAAGGALPFTVRDTAGDVLHVMFELDAAAAERIGALVERMARQQAA